MKKGKFLKALRCENLPFEIPFWELEFHLWEHFSKKKFYVGEAFTKLSSKEKLHAIQVNSEIIAEVSGEMGFSAVTVPGGYWELAPGKPAYYWLPEAYRDMQIQSLIDSSENDLALVVNVGGVMAMPEAENFVNFSVMMFDHPGEIERQAKDLLASSIRSIDKYLEMGIQVFLTASDIADNSGPYFPPEQFQQFILPYLSEWSSYIKQQGAYSILHTDGNAALYTEEIANSDVHAIQAIDPVAGMDIMELKKQVIDRLCLCGNLNCSDILTREPEIIYNISISLLESMSKFKGYSFGMSNVLETSASKESFRAVSMAYNDFTKR